VALIVLTVSLTLLLKYVITRPYGFDVQARFLERLNYVPSQEPKLLTKLALAEWLEGPSHIGWIRGYVFPVLFPFDILFLASLGVLLGLWSADLASRFAFLSQIPSWVWWTLPVLYMVADFAEDSAIAVVLTSAVPLTDNSFSLLRGLTTAKLATVSLASGQVGFLLALAGVLKIFPPKS
jgi:hypothetical protein